MQAPDPVPRPLDHLATRGRPDAPALAVGARHWSYAELGEAVAGLAAALRRAGAAPGDRVASWLPKTEASCLLPLAAARAGCVHVPVNPALKRAQTAHILADSGATLLVSQRLRAATLRRGDLPPECRLVEDAALLADRTDGLPPSDAEPDVLAAILYTSGSTGRAKGVMLSHANLWLGAVSVAHYLGLDSFARTLCVLPLAFDYGQNQLLSTWAAGGCAVAFDYLLPADVVRAVDREGITVLAGVPPLWLQLAGTAWPATAAARLRTITNSGGRLPMPLVARLRALFPRAALHSMYGLTEAFRASSLDPALIDTHPDAIGTAIPFAELAVLRPDGSPAADGEEGELVQQGPLLSHGYWQDPAATALRFRTGSDGRPALWSGDTVVRGRDGLLRFVGRADEMIKTAGNRVSPTEIEEAALASGLVDEAMAFGVPDPRLGEAVRLVVSGDGARDADLRRHLKAELPGFMQPAAIRWHDDLPKGATGKLDRARIRADGSR